MSLSHSNESELTEDLNIIQSKPIVNTYNLERGQEMQCLAALYGMKLYQNYGIPEMASKLENRNRQIMANFLHENFVLYYLSHFSMSIDAYPYYSYFPDMSVKNKQYYNMYNVDQ